MPVVKKGTMGYIFGKKIRKSIDSKDQIRLCFHEKKRKNYCCCLCSSKGFSTGVNTSFARVIASLIPAASKPLIMDCFGVLDDYMSQQSTEHGEVSLSLRDTLILPGATPFDNCC